MFVLSTHILRRSGRPRSIQSELEYLTYVGVICPAGLCTRVSPKLRLVAFLMPYRCILAIFRLVLGLTNQSAQLTHVT